MPPTQTGPDRPVDRSGPPRVVVRRADRPGDLGWMVQAHGEVYAEQLGWDVTFEALVARIVADLAEARPDRDGAWIAEVDARRAGCVLCVDGATSREAVLRILLVLPQARGRGVGAQLVRTCIEHARRAGRSRLSLWTNDVLSSARRIYQAEGFVLEHEEPHRSFGQALVGQTWALDLGPDRT